MKQGFNLNFIMTRKEHAVATEVFRLPYVKIGTRRNILFLGEEEVFNKISEILKKEKNSNLTIKHFIPLDAFNPEQIDLDGILSEYDIHEILIGSNEQDYESLFCLIEFCRSHYAAVKVISEKLRIIPDRLSTEKYCGVPVIDFTKKYNYKAIQKIKRLTDIVLSIIAIIILSPLFLFISAAIKLTSKGPITFKQKRIGLYGKEFEFYKFRSMHVVNGEDEIRKEKMLEFMRNNNAEKIINDSRVTSIGKILRKTSVDELPQLINVLKGEMSLVGPRPSLPYEFEYYEPWQKKRISVMPGCTGIWQVNGRSSVNFTDSIIMDLYYVNNMSPVMDIKLILKTIPVMAFSRGGK